MIRYPSSIIFFFVISYRVYAALWTDHPVVTWVLLEIRLISLIPFLPILGGVRYFIVQRVGSILFFRSVISTESLLLPWVGIGLKLGSAPLHWWVPTLFRKVRWPNIILISSVIKVVPLAILDIGLYDYYTIIGLVLLNTIVGAYGGIRQVTLKKLIAYSGINHLGWILASIIVSSSIWAYYLLFYTLNIILLARIVKYKDLSVYFILLSLGGIPPLIGFFPKLVILKGVIIFAPFLAIFILLRTALALFYYIMLLLGGTLGGKSWGNTYLVAFLRFIPSSVIPMLYIINGFSVIAF